MNTQIIYFQSQVFHLPVMFLKSTGFKCFAKIIMGGNYVFYCSSHIRSNPTSHLNFKIHDVTTWLTNNCNSHIFPNISRSKSNQIMKLGQLVDYDTKNIFLENLCRKLTGRLVPDHFLFFKYQIKASGLQLSFNVFW